MKTYGYILLAILILFIGRVVAQLMQLLHPVSFLPSFEIWQSGALPYPVLLMLQIIIIALMLAATVKFFRGTIVVQPTKGRIYFFLGSLYFVFMLIRFIAGFTVAHDGSWFDAPFPSFFHMMLALFVIIIGLYHKKYSHEQI